MVVTCIDEGQQVRVPMGVTDIEAFRRWTEADDFPEDIRIWWLKGEVWVDISKEQLFSHVLVKTEITAVHRSLSREEPLGIYFTDGVLLSNFAADISGNPDGLFLSHDTLASERIRLLEGADGGFTELQGSPDMVLEILSKSSERKDTVILRQAYHQAGVREYWLVDARNDPLVFDIFPYTHGATFAPPNRMVGSAPTSLADPSASSSAGGRQGHPDYTLEVQ